MIDPRGIELLNLALDDELSASEADELEQLLSASEPLRQYQQELAQVAQAITSIPDLPLPGGLHERIVDNISLPEIKTRRSWQLPAFLRYGFAAAAGLVLAVGIYELTPQMAEPEGYESMMGSMVPEQPVETVVVDVSTLKRDGLNSTARLEARDGVLVLDIVLDASEPVTLNVSLQGPGLAFGALSQDDSQFESFDLGDRRIQARGRGRQQFSVRLNRSAASSRGARVQLEYSGGEGWVHQDELDPDQAP